MKRKEFLTLGGSLIMTSLLPGRLDVYEDTIGLTNDAENSLYQGSMELLGGMSLRKLLDYHRNYLMETYIPNWNRGVDWKYGGFADELVPGREPDFELKSMYFQARAVWVFSYLYNHITKDTRHLEAAMKGRDFLKKNALTDDIRWISLMNRKGKSLSDPLNHYGDIYMILGLTELYIATKDEGDLSLAIQTAHSVMDRLVSPSYQQIGAHGSALEPGTHKVGDWIHLLSALTPLLKLQRDPAIEKYARFCVRNICERHWKPEHGLLFELLDDQFQPFTFDALNWGEPNLRHFNGWHCIQASWMIMDEALRVKHYPTFRLGIDMGFSTLDKLYVDGKGIITHGNPGYPEGGFKPWGALDEVLVFCLMVLEHSHDTAALKYYNKCFGLYNSKPENFQPECLLHVPRRFFFTINILNRIIENKGRISGFWDDKT